MFGTLVSTDLDQGTLEFVENPDPVAAVSRNLRDKIHISCTFCRSRKIRCSGERKRCQRCVAMGFECVYPKDRGWNKRQEKDQSRRAVTQRTTNSPIRMASDETETRTRNSSVESVEQLALDDLHDITFDDSCIDESFFAPWIMDTPMQYSLDSGSSSSSRSTETSAADVATSQLSISVQSRCATVSPPSQLHDPSTTDTPFTILRASSSTDSAGDLGSWEEPRTTHANVSWAMDIDGQDLGSPMSRPSPLDLQGKSRTKSDSCRCLLSSISFLERLVSRSSSRENRIDLLLTDVRDSIERLAKFISCDRCAAQAEQNMLLAMAARQISAICGKTANCYKTMHIRSLGETNTKQKSELSASANRVDISVSTYRVNQRERLHLLKSLVTLQIAELQQHINTIKSRYRSRPNQGQVEALVEAKNHIKLAQVAISSHS